MGKSSCYSKSKPAMVNANKIGSWKPKFKENVNEDRWQNNFKENVSDRWQDNFIEILIVNEKVIQSVWTTYM